ncbi:xanthine dehydrogenase family protein molybdopterin-binding subunit [Noviherbaspirillum pedocola]|uniref:Xanthine dehydrogenase family protein molybdopterin-binding subunit n=1 Tax=Noviherbaspirillum pedocola TaxID=2801341 RepID=A0A934W7J1_9BURK|nr:xanthine dehydrogenase family protein molybdopterin-binding subunit [Noviherbaspirillum pedocola]MBK4735643.1 xanthine dehydrogenase family protein molybdopterin-binding subunit [Noviherbaspirillum pedocola]
MTITIHSKSADAQIINVSRRRFFQGLGGLTLGLALPPLLTGAGDAQAAGTPSTANFQPNAFVRIGADDSVTVIAKHLEMGQGAYTGLATLVAEELDADWKQIRVEGAPADVKRYANTLLGVQGTGGSTAMANSYEQMRRAGAAARAMLVQAAAQQWQVAPESLSVQDGVVTHAASGRRARFGQLAEAAAKLPVPENAPLKDPKDFRLIGRQNLHRVDNTDKTNGRALYTQDVKLPGMLVAVIAHPPKFGAKLKSFDAAKAKAVPGVVAVVPVTGSERFQGGVAVLAKNTWVARRGRDALAIEWDESKAFSLSSDAILARYRDAASRPGELVFETGNPTAAFAKPAKLIEADYEVPFLSHSAMEPLNCVVSLSDKGCEIINGEQWQTGDQMAAAQLLGIAPEAVTIKQLYAGGSFGRRANPFSDYVLEAVAIAKAARETGVRAPVKMVWTREDDTRGGYYRPAFVHRTRMAIDADGNLAAWHHRVVGQSIFKGTAMEKFVVKNGLDTTSYEGTLEPYAVPNARLELHTAEDIGVPIQWFRSVGHSHSAFVSESLIDEAAAAGNKDPLALRRTLLAKHPRHLAALNLAAEKAGWGQPLAPGKDGERRGRGIAVHESFNTVVAQVAEVTVAKDGALRVDRVVCAVNCGVAINPDVIRAQMEGGVGFGLSAALHGAITLKDGQVQQSNFHEYPVLRINEMPRVEVHIVPSAEKPTGVGEPGVPPVAPAVTNAIHAAIGKRIRVLPIGDQLKTSAA